MSKNSQHSRSKRQPVVMLVDDEEMMTSTLSTYLELETDYDVVAFQSPLKAIEYLQKKPVDLLISDFLMPEMDGLELIATAQKVYPNLPTVLLTGYADKQNAIKAINEVKLYQYIEKPWDNEHMKLVIRNAIHSKTLEEILSKKVKELDEVLLERDTLMQDNVMLKEEMMLAQNVQESLLPQNLPNTGSISITAKYQPALEIGGDFYDVIPLANHKQAILIADVTGHGIQAALVTVLLKTAFARYQNESPTPVEILCFMNSWLYKILPKNLYVAGLVVVVDMATSRCTLVNAGIPYPFHFQKKEKILTSISASGLLLGVADEEMYKPGEEFIFELQSGDQLVLFTDGISEVRGVDESHFQENMYEVLLRAYNDSVDGFLDHLVEAAQQFSKPDHKWDDITILTIAKG